FFDISEWRKRAEQMLMHIQQYVEKYPASFGNWALSLQALIYGFKEIVLMDADYASIYKQILKEYIPLRVLQASSQNDNTWPLLKDKPLSSEKTKIYICENYNCLQPVYSFNEFKAALKKHF